MGGGEVGPLVVLGLGGRLWWLGLLEVLGGVGWFFLGIKCHPIIDGPYYLPGLPVYPH